MSQTQLLLMHWPLVQENWVPASHSRSGHSASSLPSPQSSS